MTNYELDRIVKLEGTDYDRRRKLTNKQIASMKRARANGATIADIAACHKVSYGTAYYHVKGGYKEEHNKARSRYKASTYDYVTQRDSRLAHKRAILEGRI